MPYGSLVDRTDASPFIPEQVSNEIIQSLPEQSAAMSLFRSVRMSSKSYRQPVMSTFPTAYFVDGDTGLKQTTEMAWANKYLTAEELAVIVPIPEAVIDDANFDIWGEVRPRLVEAIAIAIDAAVFFGVNKPSSWPAAVIPAAATAGNAIVRGAVGGQDLAGDINAVMELVEADGFDVNAFVGRIGLKGSLRNLRTASDKALLYQPSLQAGTPAVLYGQPIRYIRNDAWDATQADLLAGDFSMGIMGIRQDLQWKLLTEATLQDNTGAIIYNLAQQDMVAMRVTMRVAYQVANPINRAQKVEANRFPFAVLRPTGYV